MNGRPAALFLLIRPVIRTSFRPVFCSCLLAVIPNPARFWTAVRALLFAFSRVVSAFPRNTNGERVLVLFQIAQISPLAFSSMAGQITREKTDQSRTEMKQPNPTVDDSFERARSSFFGSGKTTMNPSASPADFLETRNDSANPANIQPTDMPHAQLSQPSSFALVEKVAR